MIKDDLKTFVLNNANLVTAKQSSTYPNLRVLKYKHKVFYDALWNEYLEECRGTVIDSEFNVVTRPFTKIYNWGIEKRAPVLAPDTPITAYRKVNGFMVAVSLYEGELLISTTGSLDSDFVGLAREMMLKHQSLDSWKAALANPNYDNMTFMFECVHPNDPHIIEEKAGMYLIGWRTTAWDSIVQGYGVDVATAWQKFARNHLRCFEPEVIYTTVGELAELSNTVTHEGFVAYTEDGQSFKIKSPYYLFNKFIARKAGSKLINILQNKSFMQTVDEEFYPLCEYLCENIQAVADMSEQQRLAYIREYIYNTK